MSVFVNETAACLVATQNYTHELYTQFMGFSTLISIIAVTLISNKAVTLSLTVHYLLNDNIQHIKTVKMLIDQSLSLAIRKRGQSCQVIIGQ